MGNFRNLPFTPNYRGRGSLDTFLSICTRRNPDLLKQAFIIGAPLKVCKIPTVGDRWKVSQAVFKRKAGLHFIFGAEKHQESRIYSIPKDFLRGLLP